jgi:hypothetical protein
MDNRRGHWAASDEERWLFVGRHPCCPPLLKRQDDPGSLFDEAKMVALLRVMALIARHPYCIQPQHGKAVDAEALASRRSEPPSSDDDGGLSDSGPESSSDDNGCLSDDEQGCSSTSKHSRWTDLDGQRLLAYKKEGKSWEWIFGTFPARTRPPIRTRWNMIQSRGD